MWSSRQPGNPIQVGVRQALAPPFHPGHRAAVVPGEDRRQRSASCVDEHARLAHAGHRQPGDVDFSAHLFCQLHHQEAHQAGADLPEGFSVVFGSYFVTGGDPIRRGGAQAGDRLAIQVNRQDFAVRRTQVQTREKRPSSLMALSVH